jgi:hypothetical protein
MIIVLGFTRSERAANYFPTMDGYRPGAEQVLVPLHLRADADAGVTVPQGLTGIQWGHAMFAATNLPPAAYGADQEPPAVTAIRHALDVEPPRFWQAMSIGDTLTVNGEVWACGRGSSWELVENIEATQAAAMAAVMFGDDDQ